MWREINQRKKSLTPPKNNIIISKQRCVGTMGSGQDNTQTIIDPFKKNIFDIGWSHQYSGSASKEFLIVNGKVNHHNARGRPPKDIPSSPP